MAELYRNRPDFDLEGLVRELVESQAVPSLPVQRYRESGLRNRAIWEEVWNLQRREDAIEAQVRQEWAAAGRKEDTDEERRALEQEIRRRQAAEVGDIPVPPKYKSADFKSTTYWQLRGKLDVPKERWVIYPGCERSTDPSPVIAWAGWDHLQQAQAIAEYLEELKSTGASDTPQILLLAALDQLVPWLLQWHNELNPEFGERLGDYFRNYVRDELRRLGRSEADLRMTAYGPSN